MLKCIDKAGKEKFKLWNYGQRNLVRNVAYLSYISAS